MAEGALIVLEGAEGVGKTTQLQLLASRCREAGVTVVCVREPGTTPLGDDVRRILLDSELAITARAEALLFMASRAQLVEQVIRPAINDGAVVLTDRFFLSTYAYQSFGRGLDVEEVRELTAFATDGVRPDLTLLLDLPDDDGMARVAVRGPGDRIERYGRDFHARVASAFREFSTPAWQARHPECGPIVRVDALGTPEEVSDRIWQTLGARWSETFRSRSGSHH